MQRNSDPTPCDLRFRLFGIPVRVHASFWLFPLATGWDSHAPASAALWVACLFFAALVHELGHALAARRLAARSSAGQAEIVLYIFGGHSRFDMDSTCSRRIVAIFLGGPAASVLFYLLAAGLDQALTRQGTPPQDGWWEAVSHLQVVNLWWGLVNLLPVFPLDGGQVSKELLRRWRKTDGESMSLKASLLIAAGISAACFAFSPELLYPGIFFWLLSLESWQALRGGDGFYR